MMKKMTCKQLGGACDMEFSAGSFEEMAEKSKQHGMEMFQMGDEAHMHAMNQMKGLMGDPEAMKTWMADKRQEFEALPDSSP